MVNTNFGSIVLDDHWFKKIYRLHKIVDVRFYIHLRWSCFILIFSSFLFSRFSFLRNVERPSSGKNRSIYFSNCHWPTQAPSIIWPNKKPFNEMRENLGNHKSKTARIIYLGAMIYLRRIYDMFRAMKSNFLKPFFCALYISFNNLQVKTAWNRHIWKTWTLISTEGHNHLPIKIHISPLLFFLTFYWQR